MTDLLRTAIVGTAQAAASTVDAGGAADDLVARLGPLERERALLLRAGAHALLRRAARVPATGVPAGDAAGEESLRLPSPRAAALLRELLDEDEGELLMEALARMERACLRLPEELLPKALGKAAPALRERLRPVLGARGAWLARLRPAWAWGIGQPSTEALPADVEARFAEGTQAERAALLAATRRLDPPLARKLVETGWKQEKAEQRLAWIEVLGADLSSDDEPLVTSLLADRSAQVRTAAARLLWRLPESELSRRLRARVDALVAHRPPSGGVLSRIKSLVRAASLGSLEITLPAETFDAAWEREGIVESAPAAAGRRQFWLAQMISAVPPSHFAERFQLAPAELLAVAGAHDLGSVLLDGWTAAALRYAARDWYAPLWDGWRASKARPMLVEQPLLALTERLSPAEAGPRALALLESDDANAVLARVPRPWSERLSRASLAHLGAVRPSWISLLPVAAFAIPPELLPDDVAIPDVAPDDYTARAALRALERFLTVARTRRAIHQEISP